MKKCKACEKELTGKRVYCDDACRMAYNRRGESAQEGMARMGFQPEQIKPNIEPEQDKPNTQVEQLTRQQLKTAIDSYPEDTWKDSPEYKELVHRLHTRSVEELKADGYWIPSWKVSAGAVANTPACAQAGGKP